MPSPVASDSAHTPSEVSSKPAAPSDKPAPEPVKAQAAPPKPEMGDFPTISHPTPVTVPIPDSIFESETPFHAPASETPPAPPEAHEKAPPAAVYSAEEEINSSIPTYNPDQPLPASALDGFVLDEQEVLNAIVQVDTQSVEQEAQVLEAVEAIHSAHGGDDELLEDSPLETPGPLSMPSVSSPPKPASAATYTPPPPPSAPSGKSNVKHGFF